MTSSHYLCLALCFCGSVCAQPEYFTAPFGDGGTWNLYEIVGAEYGSVTTWYGARLHAVGKADPLGGTGSNGHLVSVLSIEENEYLNRLVGNTRIWIGLTDNEMFGGSEAGSDRDGNWVWSDGGGVYGFQHWAGGEPSNSGVGEDAVSMAQAGFWVDEQSNIPGSGETAPFMYAYIIEWETRAAAAVSGAVAMTAAVVPPLPGPTGSNGVFGVRAVRDNGELRSMADAVRSLKSGSGTVMNTTATVINHHDPDSPDAGGIFPLEHDYPGDTPGSNDDNVVLIFRGRISVPSSGEWTFGVHSDDGFALHIPGARWSQAFGAGFVDPIDRSFLQFLSGTGDSNTRGVINLTTGVHRIEFITYDGVGGSGCEVYAAKGQYTNDADTTEWQLVGGASPTNGLRLVGRPDIAMRVLGEPGPSTTTVSWSSEPGAVYRVDCSSNLVDWSTVATGLTSHGMQTTFEFSLPTGATSYFIRALDESW